MNDLSTRLRAAELEMHTVWSAHCAGAQCREEHKPIWNEIQACLIDAANELEGI